MTAGRSGALQQVANIARATRPQFTLTELQEAISAPPAIGEIFDEILAEATWLTDRPARVPNTGRRA